MEQFRQFSVCNCNCFISDITTYKSHSLDVFVYPPAHLGWSKDQILLCKKCDFWAHKCVQVYLRSEIVSWDCFVSNAPSCLSVSVNRSCLAVAVLMITCAVPLSTCCLVSSDGVIVNTCHLAVSLSAYYYCVILLCCYYHCVIQNWRRAAVVCNIRTHCVQM